MAVFDEDVKMAFVHLVLCLPWNLYLGVDCLDVVWLSIGRRETCHQFFGISISVVWVKFVELSSLILSCIFCDDSGDPIGNPCNYCQIGYPQVFVIPMRFSVSRIMLPVVKLLSVIILWLWSALPEY